MTSGVLKIKAGIAWFPAPVQWRALMAMISDGAFKLFVYVCLNADRRTARFQFNQTALARELGKSRRSIATYLGELQAHSVCTVTMSANQHAAGGLQIQAPYWPFEWDIPQIPTTLGAQECRRLQRICSHKVACVPDSRRWTANSQNNGSARAWNSGTSNKAS